MATYTTLSALFTDVANAIRAKTGGSANIVADDFPTEIAAIPSGDDIVTQLCNQDNTKDIVFPAVTTLRQVLFGLAGGGSWFTRKIVIPSGVATIAASFVNEVFRYANGELRIPATVSYIGSSAFYNYGIGGSGISLYIEGGSVGLSIDRYGFQNVKLVSAYLPARITALGFSSWPYVFNNCTALESVTVEDGWDTYLDLTWSPITLESITSIITAWASNPTKSLALSTASYALYTADATAVAAAAAKGLTVTTIAR
jgi:hypothetical protein